jgi:hypothetical protein
MASALRALVANSEEIEATFSVHGIVASKKLHVAIGVVRRVQTLFGL